MPSLIGNKPNQVPSNGDLGTLAFQDANAVNITGGVVDVSAGTAALPSLGTTGDPDTGVFFPAANTIAASTNGVERMRIDSSGRLVVGGTTANTASNITATNTGAGITFGLSTYNETAVAANVGSGINFVGGTAANGLGAVVAAFSGAATTDGAYLAFQTRAVGAGLTERIRITNAGGVFMGSTVYDVVGNRITGFTVEPANGRFQLRGSQTSGWATSTSVGTHVQFYTDNGTASVAAGSIGSNGSTTSYVTSSDYRLKENIAPMTGALAKVQALKPVTYSWKGDGSSGQGFIAHELQAVVPECVTGEKDDVNEDGSIKAQGIDTSFLVATLTAAIQELKTELDSVKAELATLKA